MLETRNISKKFGSKLAVDNISFALKPGDILGLLGTNGAGKTTTFRMVLGVFKPDSGEIILDGQRITVSSSPQIGFLPEERSLLPKYTINEQLLFFGELKGKSKKELEPEIEKWLKYFGLSEHRYGMIKELSKGNQQKVQFISSILHQPKLLILDEPFSGLDPLNIKLIKDVILKLKSEGAMIIFSSHRLDYVESFSENIIVLQQGKPILEGNIEEIKKAGNKYVVNVECEDEIVGLESLEYIEKVLVLGNKYKLEIIDYKNIDSLFAFLKKYPLRGFNVELPSLEDLLIDTFGGDDEQ